MASRRYRLSRQAVGDLEAISRYIGERSIEAADRVIDELENTFKMLALNPQVGTSLEELRPGLRAFMPPRPAHHYAILFHSTTDCVVITDVVHSARDWLGMITRGDLGNPG